MLKELWDDFRGMEEELALEKLPKKEGITVTDAAQEKIKSICIENEMKALGSISEYNTHKTHR